LLQATAIKALIIAEDICIEIIDIYIYRYIYGNNQNLKKYEPLICKMAAQSNAFSSSAVKITKSGLTLNLHCCHTFN
jgi:hypothetical protein